jgi:DNA-binding FrmR family transcriptional regulator
MADVTGPEVDSERKAISNRLKRLEGQIRGLQRMVESGQECEPILTQVTAAKAAFNQVGLHIIAYAMKTCLAEDESASHDEIVDEALRVFLKYVECVR